MTTSPQNAVSPVGRRAEEDRKNSRERGIWDAVDALLERAEPQGILGHGLGGLEARRLRALGRPIPAMFEREERAAIVVSAMTVPLLDRVRKSCDGPLVLVKGPEVARLYPHGGRMFDDLDLLTPRAEAVQQELLDSGFLLDEADNTDVADHHHLLPLVLKALPLTVEVHKHVNWPMHLRPPQLAEILEASVPTRLGVDGVLTPCAHHHALILAAHSWRHQPLRLIRDLLDVARVSAEADERDIEATAAAWGFDRVWRTTRAALGCLFYGERRTAPLLTWARHLKGVRDRSAFEWHVAQCLAPFWESPPRRAFLDSASVLGAEIRPG